MASTIDRVPTDATPGAPVAEPERDRHRQLVEAVRDELLTWNPREFISAFRRWHHGSFSLIHLNVLMLLETDGPGSMSRLAEALDVSVASMTGIVDRMERRGLVERRHEVKDRRVVVVHPTPGGLDVFRDIDERRRAGLVTLLEQLSSDELAGLLTGHRAMRQARARVAAVPPHLHRPSTIPGDDEPVQRLTGASR